MKPQRRSRAGKRRRSEGGGNESTTRKKMDSTTTTTTTMPQNDETPKPEEFPWKSVAVSFAGEPSNSDHDQDEHDDNNTRNHYDHPTLQGRAAVELEASAHEAAGIFFGLQVLDGNSYRIQQDPVTHQKLMVPTTNTTLPAAAEESTRTTTTTTAHPAGEDSTAPSSTRTREKKRDAKKQKNKKKKKQKRKKPDETNQQNSSSSTPEKAVSADPSTPKEDDATNNMDDPLGEGTTTPHHPLPSHDDEEEQLSSLQTSWSAQTGGVALHPTLCTALLNQGFWTPTPIQAAALPAALLGRRNIVGAAPTGSGKTLAFLLPMGQVLLEQEQQQLQEKDQKDKTRRSLQALILTPTRELALQIQAESDKLLGKGRTGTLVGGLAHAKQGRILEHKRPPILVATPGRLWEMVRTIRSEDRSVFFKSHEDKQHRTVDLDIHRNLS